MLSEVDETMSNIKFFGKVKMSHEMKKVEIQTIIKDLLNDNNLSVDFIKLHIE